MPVDITISHPSLNGPHEARSFIGGGEGLAAELAEFGIEHLQVVGGGPETRRFERGTQRIARGDVFVRPVRAAAGEETEEAGGWSWFGTAETLRGAVRWRAVPAVVTAAGQPMRTPTGHPIFFPDGTRPLTPASGQQARDAWSGELLVDAQGQPVLVP